jgi:hypothetical protein
MNFLALYGDALDIELGTADRSALFTVARRKAAINAGQLEFVKRTGCFRKTATIPLTHGTREYDLDAAGVISSQDFLRVWDDGVEYVFTASGGSPTYRTGPDFPRRDVGWLNRNQQGWRSAPNATIPQSWYLRVDGGKAYLGLSEPPALTGGDTASITFPYVARPIDLSADGDVPFSNSADPLLTLEPWHQALAHYGAAMLERLRKNVNGEQKQLTLFAGMVADYLQTDIETDGETIFMATDYRTQAGRQPLSRAQRDPLIY